MRHKTFERAMPDGKRYLLIDERNDRRVYYATQPTTREIAVSELMGELVLKMNNTPTENLKKLLIQRYLSSQNGFSPKAVSQSVQMYSRMLDSLLRTQNCDQLAEEAANVELARITYRKGAEEIKLETINVIKQRTFKHHPIELGPAPVNPQTKVILGAILRKEAQEAAATS